MGECYLIQEGNVIEKLYLWSHYPGQSSVKTLNADAAPSKPESSRLDHEQKQRTTRWKGISWLKETGGGWQSEKELNAVALWLLWFKCPIASLDQGCLLRPFNLFNCRPWIMDHTLKRLLVKQEMKTQPAILQLWKEALQVQRNAHFYFCTFFGGVY